MSGVLSRVLVRRGVTAHDVPAPHGDSHGACAPKPISVPAFRNGLRRDRMTRPKDPQLRSQSSDCLMNASIVSALAALVA
jgi:hypothetical protein